MSDTIFLIQRTLPDDTTKKAQAVVSPDTVKKELHVAGNKDTAKIVKDSPESTKTTTQNARNTTPQQPATPKPVAQNTTAEQPAAPAQLQQEQQPLSQKDTTQSVPLHPPYIYHSDDMVQYEEIQLFNLDSLITANDSVFYHKSLLRGHSYAKKDTVAEVRHNNQQPMWVFLTLMLVMFIFGRMISNYKGRKSDILLSPFSRLSLKTLLNERAVNKVTVNLLINFLYSVLLSLAEFFVIRHFGATITGTPALDYLVLLAGTFLFIYIRVLLVKFIGSVFNYKISTGAYVLNQSICNLLCGILLVPALLLGFYSGLNATALLYVLTVIVVLMFLIRVVRGSVLMLAESQFSKIYMLYYMFVIEIVPVLVIAKWITLNM